MSLFDELKRRNVARMAALYVVASWIVMQVADYLFNALELPSAWDRLILALIILGFPIVLIFSWVFEMTPEGLKRESEIDRSQSVTHETGRKINVTIIVLLVLAILAVGADRLMPEATHTQGTQSDSLQVSSENVAPEYSIAVLPFRNRSARDDDVYFVDGIHDDILTQLARIGSLTVTSRTSVERFRDVSQQSIREIGALLGVRNILEGGIQRSGDRIRINVQLIDVTSDGHLWAETFDRELTASNLFAVQAEIAAAVADALRVALLAEEELALSETPTESLKAYDLYLLGRFHWNKRTEESIQLARDYFEQAIEEDPDYVLALSGLADSYTLLVEYGNLDGATAYPIAQKTIDKAMRLDDSVSEVWASLGLMRRTQRNYEGAEEALLRAIELDSENFSAWLWYAQTIDRMRRHEDALRATETAYALEPMSKPVNLLIARQYFLRGDFVRARQHYERSALLDEEQAIFFQNQLANTYYYEGDHTRAITTYRRILKDAPGNDNTLAGVAWSYLALGDILEARRWFSRAEAQFAYRRSLYWVFEAEEDYEGAIVYLEDKLRLDQDRRSLYTLRWLFRASYLGNDIPLAHAYIAELLENLNDRFEINPAATEPFFNLLIATFLMQHDNADGLDAERGRKMLDEIHSSLVSLREQGYRRPTTLAGLAIAYALKGDSLAAFESMNQAIDFGYRNYQYALNQPAFDRLRDSVDFVAITERIESLIEDDKARLAGTVLEPYSPPAERQPIAMSREKFREYEGYYSNGNVLAHFFVADEGAFMVRFGQDAAGLILAIAEDLFFDPKDADVTLEFVADESGTVTHLLYNVVGRIIRYKAVESPPPAVQLDRAIVARYEGTFARQLLTKPTEESSETDSWSGIISVDAQGTVWFDLDNQPKLEIVPYSETEFYMPGFAVTVTFIADTATGKVDQFEMDQDGSLTTFHRQ